MGGLLYVFSFVSETDSLGHLQEMSKLPLASAHPVQNRPQCEYGDDLHWTRITPFSLKPWHDFVNK